MGKAGSGVIGLASASSSDHIVDRLIAERGEKLVSSRHWPLIKPALYKILRYREAVRMADELGPLPGPAAMDYISRLLSLDLQITGLEHVPRKGAFIITANHPTGIADGVAVYDALRPVRPDIAIFTNRDAIRINPRLADFLIPVEWREELRDRTKMKETLRLTSRAFAEERAVVMFPSGRIAYWQMTG
jgi:putative hemolysin